MHVYSQHLYQWVWGTKHREPVMTHKGQDRLYAYIASILRNKKCHVHKINGIEDHLHIVSSLPPALDVSGLIKDMKIASGIFIRHSGIFPEFRGWQEGYGSFTYSKSALVKLIPYVENQKQHHRNTTFKEELIALLEEHDIEYDERYLW